MLLLAVLVLSLLLLSSSFRGTGDGGALGRAAFQRARSTKLSSSSPSAASSAGPELDDATRRMLDDVISANKVVLFMKGSKLFPQCGFSNTACRILEALHTPFHDVNVLEDLRIRAGIKVYSSWPTIPQLYVNREFIGGSDIMMELYNSGELQKILDEATKES